MACSRATFAHHIRLSPFQSEAVRPAPLAAIDKKPPEDPGEQNIPKIDVAHPVTGFQRGKIVPLDVRDDSLVSLRHIRFQRSTHTRGMEPLPTVIFVGKAFIHVNVL